MTTKIFYASSSRVNKAMNLWNKKYNKKRDVQLYCFADLSPGHRIKKLFKGRNEPDILVEVDGVVTQLIELKLSDLFSSLWNNRLESELMNYKKWKQEMFQSAQIVLYVIYPTRMEYKNIDGPMYARYVGKFDGIRRRYPDVIVHSSLSDGKLFEKLLKNIIKGDHGTTTEYIPLMIEKNIDKGFILSMAMLINGMTEEVAYNIIVPVWHANIKVNDLINASVAYDGKKRKALMYDFWEKVNETWLRE